MKKILILTAGYGEGHNTAARNIRAGLEAVAGGEVDARVLDPLETTYGPLNEWTKKAYLATINHLPMLWEKVYGFIDSTAALQENPAFLNRLRNALEATLDAEQPQAVVSTYPLYNYAIRSIYQGEGKPRHFSQITVITDSISVNSVWYRAGSDAFIVANEETAAVVRERGVAPEKVHVLGFPVSLRFADCQTIQPPSMGERWRVLYVINSGKRDAPNLVRQLLDLDGIDLKVTVGRDQELRTAIEAVVAEREIQAEVLGWTDRLPDLMCDSHLLISKAGGATVQESLAACTPMVMTQVVPGQEEGNARLLVQNQCGVLAGSTAEIVSTVRDAFADDGALWRQWCANIARLHRPDSAREIAQFVLSL